MAANFEIVAQIPWTTVNSEGRVVPAVQITFKSKPSNQTGRVTIEDSNYSTDEAMRVVGERATVMEAVQAL